MVLNTEFKTFFKIKAQCLQSFPVWCTVNEMWPWSVLWVTFLFDTFENLLENNSCLNLLKIKLILLFYTHVTTETNSQWKPQSLNETQPNDLGGVFRCWLYFKARYKWFFLMNLHPPDRINMIHPCLKACSNVISENFRGVYLSGGSSLPTGHTGDRLHSEQPRSHGEEMPGQCLQSGYPADSQTPSWNQHRHNQNYIITSKVNCKWSRQVA